VYRPRPNCGDFIIVAAFVRCCRRLFVRRVTEVGESERLRFGASLTEAGISADSMIAGSSTEYNTKNMRFI